MNDETVLIKKYANRRLYNTQTSSYVTLEDLAQLVRENTNFVVQDAKTEEDMTRQVLMQIILDQELAGAQMMPEELLKSLIRYYNTDMHQQLAQYLTQSTRAFYEQGENLYKGIPGFGNFKEIQEQQAEWFKKTMEMMTPKNS